MKTFKLKDLMVNIQPRQAELSEHYLTDCDTDTTKSCSPPSSDNCDDDTTTSCSPPSSDNCDDDTTKSCSPPSSDKCEDDRTTCSPPSAAVEEKLNIYEEFSGLDKLKKSITHLQHTADAVTGTSRISLLN